MGKVYGEVPRSNAEDTNNAVAAAKRAFGSWKRTTAQQRSELMMRLADLLEQNKQRFAEAESKDTGKPVSVATNVDISRVVSNFRFYAGAILHEEALSTHINGQAVTWTVNQPVGVCGLISPWNLPLYLLSWKIAPAVATGNTCVCKPSEFTSVSAWMLCELVVEAGFPPGVINMVFGLGAECGTALTTHPDVPLISFTGGTATGERIAASVAAHHKKLSLELGGKNAAIVFADCDFEKAVNGVVQSAFANSGQICLCCSRILIQESIFDKFVSAMVERTKSYVIGDPTSSETRVGALISQQHFEKVSSYIELAKVKRKMTFCIVFHFGVRRLKGERL